PLNLSLTIADRVAPTFFLYCLTANVGSVVEKAPVLANQKDGDLGNEWLKTNSAGSGPFVIRSWRASESVVLEANPNARMRVHPRRVLIRHIPDPSSQLLQLRAGDIDIARSLLPDQLRSAAADPNLRESGAARSYIMYLAMNQKDPNLSKPQVRQAIKWAIDYDGIQRNIVAMTHQVQQSFIPQGLPAAITDRPFARDVAKARSLLAEAGVSNLEFTLDHGSSQPVPDIAQAVQANLAEVGIKVNLISAEARAVLTKYRARQHQRVIQAWGIDYFDPHTNAETFCINADNSDDARAKTLAWRNAWVDEDLTKRAQDAVRESDAEKREAMYVSMQRDHHQRSPFALMFQSFERAIYRKEVAGFAVAPMS
ncbi:ABC transporter substrate-binding protein, partial [Nostoc sp. NIES-2111]